jgi:hypothetical protein
MGEVATRDFLRSELGRFLDDLSDRERERERGRGSEAGSGES